MHRRPRHKGGGHRGFERSGQDERHDPCAGIEQSATAQTRDRPDALGPISGFPEPLRMAEAGRLCAGWLNTHDAGIRKGSLQPIGF